MSLCFYLFLRRLRLHCMEQLLRISDFLSHVHPNDSFQRLPLLSKILLFLCRLQPILIILWLVLWTMRKSPRPCSLFLLYNVFVLSLQSPCLVKIRIDFSNYLSNFLQDSRFIWSLCKRAEVFHDKRKVSFLFWIFCLCCLYFELFRILSHRTWSHRCNSRRRRRNHLVRICIFESWCTPFLIKMKI